MGDAASTCLVYIRCGNIIAVITRIGRWSRIYCIVLPLPQCFFSLITVELQLSACPQPCMCLEVHVEVSISTASVGIMLGVVVPQFTSLCGMLVVIVQQSYFFVMHCGKGVFRSLDSGFRVSQSPRRLPQSIAYLRALIIGL